MQTRTLSVLVTYLSYRLFLFLILVTFVQLVGANGFLELLESTHQLVRQHVSHTIINCILIVTVSRDVLMPVY